jgi:hypothetical protein
MVQKWTGKNFKKVKNTRHKAVSLKLFFYNSKGDADSGPDPGNPKTYNHHDNSGNRHFSLPLTVT